MKKRIRQTRKERSLNLATAPYLVRNGAIRKRDDVVDELNRVLITSDHLLVLCEILIDHMWVEHTDGVPLNEREKLLKDTQYTIRKLFEIALASKFIRHTSE